MVMEKSIMTEAGSSVGRGNLRGGGSCRHVLEFKLVNSEEDLEEIGLLGDDSGVVGLLQDLVGGLVHLVPGELSPLDCHLVVHGKERVVTIIKVLSEGQVARRVLHLIRLSLDRVGEVGELRVDVDEDALVIVRIVLEELDLQISVSQAVERVFLHEGRSTLGLHEVGAGVALIIVGEAVGDGLGEGLLIFELIELLWAAIILVSGASRSDKAVECAELGRGPPPLVQSTFGIVCSSAVRGVTLLATETAQGSFGRLKGEPVVLGGEDKAAPNALPAAVAGGGRDVVARTVVDVSVDKYKIFAHLF
mmetsp:Transcript_17657/g.29835  ORF Transcript_17657/g.29835 Transcript_17657/m.29835 type:complete len:306 (+) Transcript_17657:312-1229(+)